MLYTGLLNSPSPEIKKKKKNVISLQKLGTGENVGLKVLIMIEKLHFDIFPKKEY